MSDLFRSVTVLGIASVTVVAMTIGLASIIIPGPTISPVADASAGPSHAPSAVAAPFVPGRIGGTITVSGDRDETFTVSRESTDTRYALVGDRARIYFEGNPPTVAQVSFSGMEFFLEPDQCSLVPGRRDDETGVADAQLHCESIADVRGGGVVTLDGTVGIAADLVGMRGDLPPLGGTITIGPQVLTFEDSTMVHPRFSSIVGQLADVDGRALLVIAYDSMVHAYTLEELTLDGRKTTVEADACNVSMTEIGVVNPHAWQMELSISCDALEVVGLGTVDVYGNVMVDEVAPEP